MYSAGQESLQSNKFKNEYDDHLVVKRKIVPLGRKSRWRIKARGLEQTVVNGKLLPRAEQPSLELLKMDDVPKTKPMSGSDLGAS